MSINIDLSKLGYSFTKKPLIVGGMAMDYYGLRKTGKDIDLIVTRKDCIQLAKKYPKKLKDLGGDFGVAVHGFEIWKTIRYFDYDFWTKDAIEKKTFLMMSLDRLLFLKVLAMEESKYLRDLKLISRLFNSKQSEEYKRIKKENERIVGEIGEVNYIERK